MIDFLVYLATMAGIYGILALGLQLQYGMAGLVNLGQVAFFMLGAYTSTILVLLLGLPFALGVLGGMTAAALYGILIALPSAGLQQDYWAISTLAAAELLRVVILNTPLQGPYVGASFGVSGIPQPLRNSFPTPASYGWFYLGLVAVAVLLSYLLLRWLSRIPFGRALKAIREGDEVALALGKNPRSLRIRTMAVGGALGGLAGALFAHYNAFIEPSYFLPLETFIVWAMVILGGSGNHLGALLGAVIVQALFNSTRFLSDYFSLDPQLLASLRMIAIGILITGFILFRPRGLILEKPQRYGDTSAARSR